MNNKNNYALMRLKKIKEIIEEYDQNIQGKFIPEKMIECIDKIRIHAEGA